MKVLMVLLLLCLLYLGAAAEQIYVRNRPFKGAVTKVEGQTWIELRPLAEALGTPLQGDEQTGFWIEGEAPGPGKVSLKGTEVEFSTDSGSLMVPLEKAAGLLGARVVVNKQMGSIDVSLAPAKTSSGAGQSLTGAYNLIEYSYPDEQLCKDIQPALTQARAEFTQVTFILCNLKRPPAALMKYKQTKDNSYPEVSLVDGQGQVLFTMRGNHVIANGLVNQLRKYVKK